MVRWIVVVVLALVAVSLLGRTTVIASARELPSRAVEAVRGEPAGTQSDAQMSGAEFVALERGWTSDRVRAEVGAPESSSRSSVEGLELECWTYGIVGATGAFQVCFANDRLESRFRYDAAPAAAG
jgi:hypothetical protein